MNRNWQCYWGTGLGATIDLGQPMPLAAIRSDYLQRDRKGGEWLCFVKDPAWHPSWAVP